MTTAVISRAAWGARSPQGVGNTIAAHPLGVAVHYADANVGTQSHDLCASTIRGIQRFHMDIRGWVDIAYNLMACQHGYLYDCRGTHTGSAANGTTTANRDYYALCALIGPSDTPTTNLLIALTAGIGLCRAAGAGTKVVGHRDLFATACPGTALYSWVKSGPHTTTTTPPKETDVALTSAEIDLIAIASTRKLLGTMLGSSGPTVAVALQKGNPVDVKALAAAVAAVGVGGVSDAQLEAALRKVLGGVDGT